MFPKRYDEHQLLFRRQFVLGPRFVEAFPTWKKLEAGPTIRLTVHPDLPTFQVEREGRSVTVLGYVLDPHEPRATDADIANRLLLEVETGRVRADLLRLTAPFGGRWVLIVDDGRDPWLFNDACGYRQVFYTPATSNGVWCASQPGLLAELLGLAIDTEALEFIRAYERREPEYWWPGDSTLYREVRHLLPNHYLNLRAGEPRRFWPDHPLAVQSLEVVVEENARLLQALIESASHRFDLALTVTAGRDTRLLLAASKAIWPQLYCFTTMHWHLSPDHPDVKIPATLLPRLGLRHHVIRPPSRMDREFRKIYERNVSTAHEVYGPIAQGLLHKYPGNRVCMQGTGMPITYVAARLRALQKAAGREASRPETLAWLLEQRYGFPSEHEFGLDALGRWLSGADHNGIDILDLLYWENRDGNWAAMGQSEWDLVQESFVPFNCRLFLANALSVPEALRVMPPNSLEARLTRHLNPEVMAEPVNPSYEPTLLSTVREFLLSPAPKDVTWLYARTIGSWRKHGLRRWMRVRR